MVAPFEGKLVGWKANPQCAFVTQAMHTANYGTPGTV